MSRCIPVAVLNRTSALPDADAAAVVPVLQRQVSEHFLPAWGIDALLTYSPRGQDAPTDVAAIVLLDDSDVATALGYHDVTPAGYPLGKVFVVSDTAAGLSWTHTASHELLELLVNPGLGWAAWTRHAADGHRTLYALEVGDPVEPDPHGYLLDGVLVSNFVLPAWFEAWNTRGPYDYCGQCSAPFQVLPGGMISTTTLGPWVQLGAETVALPGSRRERLQRDEWQVSQA